MTSIAITILMPCLNEAETLGICIRKALGAIRDAGVSGEVIVADNVSTDGSLEIAAAEGARVINVPVRGYGSALLAGFEGAHGKHVLMADADDSHDFSHLPRLLIALEGGADLVMGNRFRGEIKRGAMPFLHRYLGNPGNEIACIGTTACVYDHYWARLAGVRVLTEVDNPSLENNTTLDHLLEQLEGLPNRQQGYDIVKGQGAKVLVGVFDPGAMTGRTPASSGWVRLGESDFYALPLNLPNPAPAKAPGTQPWSAEP